MSSEAAREAAKRLSAEPWMTTMMMSDAEVEMHLAAALDAYAAEIVNAASVVENVLRSYAEDQREDVPQAKALNLANHLRAALRAEPTP